MDKWKQLKSLIDAELSWDVHYSHERPVEKNYMYKVRRWMEDLERREKVSKLSQQVIDTHDETLKQLDDQKALQGLA